jgi:iron complex transport system ATP-binding protein
LALIEHRASPLLEAVGIEVRYGRGNPPVVSLDCLQANPGEILAVLGPNGAGKSTLLRVLAGLVSHQGNVRIQGRPIESLSPSERARRVAYLPQQSGLRAPLLVHSVVAQGRTRYQNPFAKLRSADHEAILQAMKQARVDHLADRRFTALSVGEQRRVLLARALATEARLLLLDEPTAALDVRAVLAFHQLLAELKTQEYSAIVVLHDLDEALRFSDTCLVLREGQVEAQGPTKETLSPTVVRRVYEVALHSAYAYGVSLLPGQTNPT